jgi:hypothetical protein
MYRYVQTSINRHTHGQTMSVSTEHTNRYPAVSVEGHLTLLANIFLSDLPDTLTLYYITSLSPP